MYKSKACIEINKSQKARFGSYFTYHLWVLNWVPTSVTIIT